MYQFLLSDYAEQHQLVLTGIHPFCRNTGNSTIQIFHDHSGNLIRFVRNNINRFGELQTLNDTIRHFCNKKYCNDRVKSTFHTKHIHTHNNYRTIYKLHDLCNRIMSQIFLDNCSQHICSASRSTTEKYKSNSNSLQKTSI